MPTEQPPTVQDRARWSPRLDPTVNFGHLFTASIFLLTAGTMWANLTSLQSYADRRIARLERLQEESDRLDVAAGRDIARIAEQMVGVQRDLSRFVAVLDRLTTPPRGAGDR